MSPSTRSLVVDAFLDLALGSSCVGCGRPGRPLCSTCTATLPGRADVRRASLTTPGGLPGQAPTSVCGAYDGVLRALVIAHKERRVLALTRPLGALLALAVEGALAPPSDGASGPVVLVPAPSRPRAVRQRGHDPTLSMTRRAAALCGHATGRAVVVARLLRLRPGVIDQAGLDAAARHHNLGGAMAVDGAVLRRLARRMPHAEVVLCDDVVTTGTTLGEAQRALAAVGVGVRAAACVAATPRRTSPREQPGSTSDRTGV